MTLGFVIHENKCGNYLIIKIEDSLRAEQTLAFFFFWVKAEQTLATSTKHHILDQANHNLKAELLFLSYFNHYNFLVLLPKKITIIFWFLSHSMMNLN